MPALHGIGLDLLIGAVIIAFVLLALQRNLRIALIAFLSIPLSLLVAPILFLTGIQEPFFVPLALGLAPLTFEAGQAGREVQGPMTIVILGGLVTASLMGVVLLPTLIFRCLHRSVATAISRRQHPRKPTSALIRRLALTSPGRANSSAAWASGWCHCIKREILYHNDVADGNIRSLIKCIRRNC